MATTVTIRIEDELRDQIAKAAQLQNVTTSRYIRDALANHMQFEPSEGADSDRPDLDADSPDLSPFERRILVQLHRLVLAAKGDLGNSYYDKDDEVQGIQILESGFVGDYSVEFAGIVPPMSQAECELVWDIFDMFRIIGASVRALDGGWKRIGVDEFYGTFRGFDGNHPLESRLLIYARHLVKHDRWTEQAEFVLKEGGNSHREMVPTYRAMLRVFKPLWSEAVRSGTRWHLSEKQVRQVLEIVPGVQAVDA
jgi:uncharacterized protein YfbU (UPF0304 family)